MEKTRQSMENDHPFPQVNQVFENRSHVTKALKRYSMTAHENKLPFHQIKDNGDKVIPKCNNQGCIVEFTVKPVSEDSKRIYKGGPALITKAVLCQRSPEILSGACMISLHGSASSNLQSKITIQSIICAIRSCIIKR
jgi:hypothetical protein